MVVLAASTLALIEVHAGRLAPYIANNNIKAIIRQKRPIASDKAKPRMAYEKSCAFKPGFRAKPMIKLPNTEPIPAPAKHKSKLVQ